MKVKPACPFGKYEDRMRIRCERLEGPCVHQYYKNCRGWWANSEQWTRCPVKDGACK